MLSSSIPSIDMILNILPSMKRTSSILPNALIRVMSAKGLAKSKELSDSMSNKTDIFLGSILKPQILISSRRCFFNIYAVSPLPGVRLS